ncbi:MAG: SRPBCC family protein [Candidatus Actinomarinaceae bacterium]|jgi:hypothetical protein
MPNFSRTITVKEDINTVYDFMSDFRNLGKWAEGDDGELITKEPLRLGSVFRVKTHFNSKPRVYDYEVVEWGPPLRVSLEAKASIFTIVDTIFLSANSKGTELTYSVNIRFKFPYVILAPFVSILFNKVMDTQIKSLGEVLGEA